MAVKLELYRIFKEVVEAGNISVAAKNLYISQSAVSQSVKQLETALQVRLFSRSPRGVSPTGEGRLLYDYVRSAISLLETGEDKLLRTRELLMGNLVIGASDTVTSWFLLPFLESFHREYPGIHLSIVSGRSQKVLSLLKSGTVDIAFASSPADASALATYPCFNTHGVFVAASDFPCDFEHPYTAEEITQFPLILLGRKASSRLFLEQYFLQQGVKLQPEIELSSRGLLIALSRIGLGVAGVTREFVGSALERGEIRLLKTAFEIPERSVDMCTLRDVAPTAASAKFIELIQNSPQKP